MNTSRVLQVGCVLVGLVCGLVRESAVCLAVDPDRSEQERFFEQKVRPILVEKCLACHGAEKQQGGLRLDTAAAFAKGGDSGRLVEAEQFEKSLLLEVLSYQGEIKMPPTGPLPAEQVALLRDWVRQGAIFPAGPAATLATPGSAEGIAALRESHWAFRPLRAPAIPPSTWPDWERGAIDRHVSQRLKQAGLTPSERADRAQLYRRLSFDLLGLPPSMADVNAFVSDPAPDAWEKAVDRMLASPHYGERWGRLWLDVARYADTKGYVFTEERRYPFSYTYRDYVIRAFNRDLPYDRFLQEQIAADQLDVQEDRTALAALGFLTLGRRFGNNQNDIIDDRIDVVTRGLMGLAVGCARCHDHKYDPIPTADYYSLHGVFASSVEPGELPLIGNPEAGAAYDAYVAELNKREQVVNEFLTVKRAELLDQLRGQTLDYLVAVARKESSPIPERIRLLLDPKDLRGELITRWRNYLMATKTAHHPVFAPWNQLAELPEAEFAARAAAYLATLQAEPAADAPKINPLVRKKLAALEPKSLVDVAGAYGELLLEVQRQWVESQKPVAVAEGQPVPERPKSLPDGDAEELRQVLYSDQGPWGVPPEELRRLFDRAARNMLTELRRKVDEWKVTAVAAPPRAMVLNDAPQPVAARILIRGNPGRPGEEVPRRFLQALPEAGGVFQQGSGRLELARAVTSSTNPLTPRVLVNRVWMHHFGVGLVRTPGDFGVRGTPPTHPELLDDLASRFVAQGWSLKELHREILCSATYQQSSADRPEGVAVDPENQWLWKMNRRRLDFEGLRDSLLAVAGALDPEIGGRGVDVFKPPYSARRTVYAFIDRQDLPGTFRTFDFASPDVSTPQRPQTLVPQQALYGLNSPFVIELAVRAARRAQATAAATHAGDDTVGRLIAEVQSLYQGLLSRPATPGEVSLALRFLTEQAVAEPEAQRSGLSPLSQLAQALMLSNEFVFVD
ncbi:MAG: PSD1 and planctomycete cytochrome C domain-containing protein [Planctomycetaceae bacterium]